MAGKMPVRVDFAGPNPYTAATSLRPDLNRYPGPAKV